MQTNEILETIKMIDEIFGYSYDYNGISLLDCMDQTFMYHVKK